MIDIPVEVQFVLDRLNSNGFSAYLVGGCVRDSILSKMGKSVKIKDWDIATSAKPDQIKNIFEKTVDTGIKHGTVTVVVNKKSFEVTTYRVDGEYKDCRHPQSVNFTDDLLEDLSRRDFTVNTIAYNKQVGYVDVFDGINDIDKGIIRCVGEPGKRFSEDALRMLRALRFANQLDFVIDHETYRVLKENVSLIEFVSVERVRDELLKLFFARNADKLYLLNDSGLLRCFNRDFWFYWHLNSRYLSRLILKADKVCDTMMSVVFSGMDVDVAYNFARFFRFSNKVCDTIRLVLGYLDCDLEAEACVVKKMICEVGLESFRKILRVKEILRDEDGEKFYRLIDKFSSNCIFLKDLAVKGEDVKNLGFEKSEIGFVLGYLLDFVHRFPEENDYDVLKDVAGLLRDC